MKHEAKTTAFDQDLGARLEAIRAQGLWRELRRVDSAQGPRIEIGGQTLLNFSSNDYLGLAGHPALREAAVRAVEQFGAGAGASRLICGSLAPHHQLEEALAAFKGAEAALSFSSGYAAALGVITALLGKDDLIVIDKLVHACIVDAARLCGATLRVFAHNELDDLEAILKWADTASTATDTPARGPAQRPRVLIVTESVFSMDGDLAPLAELVELKERYGAWLMVDEAHATGLFGAGRRGLAEQEGVADRIEIQMGTLGKALGAAGGYICGSRCLADFLVNRARSFIFSTAPVPAAAAAARAGVELVQTAEGAALCQQLWQRVNEARDAVMRPTAPTGHPATPPAIPDVYRKTRLFNCAENAQSAILPILVGDERRAVEIASALRERGIFIPAVRYPTVARGAARLRLTLTAAHTPADVRALGETLRAIQPPPGDPAA